ncbi:uncharacterized protein LOC129228353 [Uloborus diversus]|uniref:uncharacterized protein LOC129228353 n=1 Tax=Uloborus diversus TaxID=327109 RepID=UPI002408F666|nr:uncharacterized protein LOC129228353 [Uloborus diversus]
MVWSAIAYDAKSPLVFINGALTGQRYVQEILQPVALPFLSTRVRPLFQQDNARPHIAAVSRACLQGLDSMERPAYSRDLSPIENVWDAMGRDVNTPPVPRNLPELRNKVKAAWDRLPQDFIKNLLRFVTKTISMLYSE